MSCWPWTTTPGCRAPIDPASEAAFHYENRFRCLPLEAPFRPPRETPRPVVHGTQTAVVVGPPGEEIFTDKYGRIKVQFHWDRQGKSDADSSCWVRVATAWAGQQWGMVHIPRVGQEVVVAFEEGDPDRPIAVGSVYNAEHDAALQAAGQQDAERRQVAQQPQGRPSRTSTRSALRTRRARNCSTSAPRRTRRSRSRTTRPTGSATIASRRWTTTRRTSARPHGDGEDDETSRSRTTGRRRWSRATRRSPSRRATARWRSRWATRH